VLADQLETVGSDVDLGGCKVFIEEAKGTKNRYILYSGTR
jgi:hypothetical protein